MELIKFKQKKEVKKDEVEEIEDSETDILDLFNAADKKVEEGSIDPMVQIFKSPNKQSKTPTKAKPATPVKKQKVIAPVTGQTKLDFFIKREGKKQQTQSSSKKEEVKKRSASQKSSQSTTKKVEAPQKKGGKA